MEWEPVYAELANKLRWSISSTAAAAGINYTFQESMACANYAAAEIIKVMKMKDHAPDYRVSQESLKSLLESPSK